jgi:hypothetical protein
VLYCYIDLDDGSEFVSTEYGLEERENVKRNYKAERVGVTGLEQLKKEREGDWHPDVFLPTRKDFEKQHEHKGAFAVDNAIKDWNDRHESAKPIGDKYRPR